MWTIYKETASGTWKRLNALRYDFVTACNIARALEAAGGGRHCVNS